MTKPYTEEKFQKHGTDRVYTIRTFSVDVDEDELVWHRDHDNRVVSVLEGIDWKLQNDDELPILLEVGKKYNITEGHYHRLLKGKTKLVIRIEEDFQPSNKSII